MHVAIDAMLVRQPRTGVQRYITGLIQALADHSTGDNIRIYIGRGHGWTPPAGPNCGVFEAAVRSKSRLLRICWEQIALPFELRLEETDVLHAPAYVMPLLAPLVARRPVVLTVHDTIALDRPDLTTYLNAMHFGLTMPLSLRLARTIIVPTSVVADRLIRISVPERKIRVIPWGIDDIFTNPESRNSDDEVLERLGVERPYVLHVGALEPKKNLEYLVKAFFAFSMNSSAPHKLVLAGPKGESAGRLWRLVESLGARGNVVFTGFVADEDLPVLYRHADLVVCPSLEEGFGFTPLEALASGAPVITSDIPAFREVLGRSVPMFDPADLPALRLKLTDLLANESARAEIIAAGRERAAGYTWKRCARETLAVYSSCMA